jgi:hypothetical protein
MTFWITHNKHEASETKTRLNFTDLKDFKTSWNILNQQGTRKKILQDNAPLKRKARTGQNSYQMLVTWFLLQTEEILQQRQISSASLAIHRKFKWITFSITGKQYVANETKMHLNCTEHKTPKTITNEKKHGRYSYETESNSSAEIQCDSAEALTSQTEQNSYQTPLSCPLAPVE